MPLDGGNLSLFLQQSPGRFYDPQHGHSFHRVPLAELSAVQHGRLFFRDCLVCRQRVLSVGKPSASARRRGVPEEKLRREAPNPSCLFPCASSPALAPVKTDSVVRPSLSVRRPSWGTTQPRAGETEAICQCMDCGNFVHRACLSACHAHRKCRGHEPDLMLRCPQTKTLANRTNKTITPPVPELFPASTEDPVIKRVTTIKRKYSSSNVTIGSLIDALSEDRHNNDRGNETPPRSTKATAATVMKRAAPFLAAGGVIGALALGPAAGVIAGLNMLVAGVSVEGMVAGIGFTAATAAATASRQIKKKNELKRLQEEMKSGTWAMEICWKVKQAFKDAAVSDEVFRKDAELLRRFQLRRRTTSDVDQLQPASHFAPTNDEIYALVFGILSTSNDFLSCVNAELAKAFTVRHTRRLERLSSSGSTSMKKRTEKCKETLQDARMYVAHLVGATMQSFPSLSSTDAAIVSCSQAIERVIFDDIYKPVMGALDEFFADENTAFAASLDDIRRQPDGQQQLAVLLQHLGSQPQSTDGLASDVTPPPAAAFALDRELADAESTLVEMLERAKSPLRKLELLCSAFRAVCCFADKLHQTASNADILIPIVCALLVAAPRLRGRLDRFVSQVAFTSYFTDGGGKGVEGYVLTTFQAALQVLAAVDLSHGPAQELALYAHQDASSTESSEDERGAAGVAAEDKDEHDEFFDAQE